MENQQEQTPNNPPGWTESEWNKISGVYSLKGDFTSEVQQVESMIFEIPDDPVSLGLDNFHVLLRNAQGLQNRLTSLIQSALSSQATWGIYKRRISEIYGTRKGLYLQEAEIKGLRNESMQTVACNAKMPEIMAMKQYIEEMSDYIDGVLRILRQREKNLDSTCDKLSRQISVIGYQIQVGEISTKQQHY
jgi:hypothetical protein